MSKPYDVIAEGAGEPLILLHGMGYSARYWLPQIKAFAKDYRVIAWNMPEPAPLTFAALSQSLAALMDSLHITRAHILGHSMGGMVALDFAATYPARVKSLILFGASAAFPPPDSDFARAFVAARLAPLEAGGGMAAVAAEMARDHFGPRADPQGVKISADILAACPPESYRRQLACLTRFDRREALAALAVPTLVIAAENDINAPAKGVEKMSAKIPGATYVCLQGVGHLANLEQPDAFNRVVLDFLNRQSHP